MSLLNLLRRLRVITDEAALDPKTRTDVEMFDVGLTKPLSASTKHTHSFECYKPNLIFTRSSTLQ